MKKILLILLFTPQLIFPFSGTSYTVYNTRKFDALPQTPLPLQKNRNISVMDDQISGQKDDQINVHYRYQIPSDLTTSSITGSGTITQANSMANISTGATTGSTASLTSKRNLIYIPGHEGHAIFDAAFTTAIAGTTQFVGLFDDNDGFAIGYNGTTFSILYRKNTSDAFIGQTSFNMDPLDGTGLSSIDLDPTKLNIYKISYAWGTSTVTFEILRTDGIWFPFHQIRFPNDSTSATPVTFSPFLPVRARSTNGATTSNITITTSAWMAGNISQRSDNYVRTFAATSDAKSTSGGSTLVLLSLQNQTTFQGKANKIEARICIVNGSTSGSTNATIRYRLIKNGTLTGASFASVDTNSSIFLDTSATAITGGVINLIALSTGNAVNIVNTIKENIYISILPGETITLTAQPSSGGNLGIEGALTWQELF